jgi:hypothetical protein
MNLKDAIARDLKTGLTLDIRFSSVPAMPQHGIPEGVTHLRIFSGSFAQIQIEVREHHGRSYAIAKKAEMFAALAAIQAAVTEAILAKREAIEAAPTAEDEEEGALPQLPAETSRKAGRPRKAH